MVLILEAARAQKYLASASRAARAQRNEAGRLANRAEPLCAQHGRCQAGQQHFLLPLEAPVLPAVASGTVHFAPRLPGWQWGVWRYGGESFVVTGKVHLPRTLLAKHLVVRCCGAERDWD